MDLKTLTNKPSFFASGHRTCQGCGIPLIVRTVLRASGENTIATIATGCLEVTSTIFPQTSWEIPCIHSAFENVAATASGIANALENLNQKTNVIAFGGDGGTYDIGLQALSGALERGDNFLYICYDNQAYMNTGVQRSSATPAKSWTTTTPVGSVHAGKPQFRKNLTEIVVAHRIPYIAQASPSHILDLFNKVEKALTIKGPKFINIFSPCPLGWKMDPALSIKSANLAVQTRFWPLYEIEKGKYTLNSQIKKPTPLEEFLKIQGRFKHLKKKDIVELETEVERRWRRLLEKIN